LESLIGPASVVAGVRHGQDFGHGGFGHAIAPKTVIRDAEKPIEDTLSTIGATVVTAADHQALDQRQQWLPRRGATGGEVAQQLGETAELRTIARMRRLDHWSSSLW
jgi:hypothetical protein